MSIFTGQLKHGVFDISNIKAPMYHRVLLIEIITDTQLYKETTARLETDMFFFIDLSNGK